MRVKTGSKVELHRPTFPRFSSSSPARWISNWPTVLWVTTASWILAGTPWSHQQIQVFESIVWVTTVLASFSKLQIEPTTKSCLTLVLAVLASPSISTPAKSESVYDCSSKSTAVATYSLDEVGACPDFEHTYKNKTLIRAQILQRSGTQELEGFQCQLVYRREACYCGILDGRKWNKIRAILPSANNFVIHNLLHPLQLHFHKENN